VFLYAASLWPGPVPQGRPTSPRRWHLKDIASDKTLVVKARRHAWRWFLGWQIPHCRVRWWPHNYLLVRLCFASSCASDFLRRPRPKPDKGWRDPWRAMRRDGHDHPTGGKSRTTPQLQGGSHFDLATSSSMEWAAVLRDIVIGPAHRRCRRGLGPQRLLAPLLRRWPSCFLSKLWGPLSGPSSVLLSFVLLDRQCAACRGALERWGSASGVVVSFIFADLIILAHSRESTGSTTGPGMMLFILGTFYANHGCGLATSSN